MGRDNIRDFDGDEEQQEVTVTINERLNWINKAVVNANDSANTALLAKDAAEVAKEIAESERQQSELAKDVAVAKAAEILGYVIPEGVADSPEAVDLKITNAIISLNPYGIIWDEDADTYERVGSNAPTVQQQMKRCIVDENGEFLYYLHKDDSTKKEDGSNATTDIEGANGTKQVKVQIQKFYEKRWADGKKHYHLISLFPFGGGKTHPLFRKSGWIENDEDFENNYAYIGAFEGCLFDASANAFIDNNKENDNTGNIDSVNDKIMSIAGKKPYTGITIVEGRQLIANGGSKQYSFHAWDAINLLFYIEFGNFNSQQKLPGYTSGGNIDRIAKTGLTLSLGNKSGSIVNNEQQVAGASDTTIVANSYRGVENFFGHLWKFCDGINIQDGKPFICTAEDTFESNKFNGQYAQGKDSSGNLIQMPTEGHGYITKIHAGTFFAKENTGGNSVIKLTDYYWYSSGNRVLLSGGALHNGGSVGSFCWYGYSSSGSSAWGIAVRS